MEAADSEKQPNEAELLPHGSAPVDSSGLHWKPGRAEYFVIFTLSILSLVVALDATILVSVLPTIASELHGDTTDTFWAGSSYLLTSALFQPFIVALSDDFGRRGLLFLSVVLFTLGTVICCLSQNFAALLGGRAIQGIGGGGILSLSNVILTDVVPLRQRPTYIGVTQLSWAVGSITGPLIGGLFVQHATWRWVFYINFPFCAVGLAMVPFSVKLYAEVPSVKIRLLRLDWVGMALFMSSASSFLIGITWGGSQFPWNSWHTLAPVIAGVIGLATTAIWEVYGATRPFLPVSLLNSRSGIAAYLCALLQGVLLFCKLYYLPIYFEGVKGYSPTITGISLIPITGSLLPFSIIVGVIIRRTGRFRWAIWSGWLIITFASGLLIILGPRTHIYTWVLIFVVAGLGHGLVLTALNVCTQAMVDGPTVGFAAAMYTFSRSVGLCIGVSIGGTIFQNTLQSHLIAKNLPAALAANIEGLFSHIRTSPVHDAFVIAISQSFQNIAEFLTGIAVLGTLISLLIKFSSVDKDFKPGHILRTARVQELRSE